MLTGSDNGIFKSEIVGEPSGKAFSESGSLQSQIEGPRVTESGMERTAKEQYNSVSKPFSFLCPD